jgi:hypothetical protein
VLSTPGKKILIHDPQNFVTMPRVFLKEFLGKVCGRGFGVSILFDESTSYWSDASDIVGQETQHLLKHSRKV